MARNRAYQHRNIDVLMRGSRVETGTSFGATVIECYQSSCLVCHLFPCQTMFLHAPRRSFFATCSLRKSVNSEKKLLFEYWIDDDVVDRNMKGNECESKIQRKSSGNF